MKRQTKLLAVVLAAGLAFAASTLWANYITVTNVTLINTDQGAGTTDIQFDLSWSNSWRSSWTEGAATITNWDAAWVFVNFRYLGGNWQRVSLAPSGHSVPGGTMIDVGASGGSTNVGAFIHRSVDGHGNLNLSSVRLHWNFTTNGLFMTNQLDVSVHAIEMVYIPQGSFYVGDGTTTTTAGQFCAGTTVTTPFLITNEAYTITLGGGGSGSLGNNNATGMRVADDFNNATSQTLPAAFPKGYQAFYCMKYEITQDQYTKFLNELTSMQAASRYLGSPGNRNTIGGSWPNYTNSSPDRAADLLSWASVAAYAAWAGLRPLTELEFEKTCRGPKTAVANELAWGDTTIVQQTGFSGVDGSGTETALPVNANLASLSAATGPIRAGIYATTNSTRSLAGAGYYGVMELSGNMEERAVTVGNATGRAFIGTHGDGSLGTNGNAAVASWPGASVTGSGFRGGGVRGNYGTYTWICRVSDRIEAAATTDIYNSDGGTYYAGGRAVRTAP